MLVLYFVLLHSHYNDEQQKAWMNDFPIRYGRIFVELIMSQRIAPNKMLISFATTSIFKLKTNA